MNRFYFEDRMIEKFVKLKFRSFQISSRFFEGWKIVERSKAKTANIGYNHPIRNSKQDTQDFEHSIREILSDDTRLKAPKVRQLLERGIQF